MGEPVIYTPAGGTPVEIEAIWIEGAVSATFDDVGTDARAADLHVRAADVPAPREGDIAQRVATGKTMRVVTPIRPDDQGMIAVALEQI